MNSSKERKLGAILSYASIGVNFIIGFFVTPIILKYLGDSEYGVYTLVASLCAYLNVIEQGLADTVVKYFIKFKVEKNVEKEEHFCAVVLLINFILSLMVLAAGAVLYVIIPSVYENSMSASEILIAKKLLILMVLNLIVSFMFNLYQGILTASEKFVMLRITDMINLVLSNMAIVFVLILGGRAFSIVMITLLTNTAISLYKFIYCKTKLHSNAGWHNGVLDMGIYKELFCYFLAVLIVVIVEQIYWKLDNILISFYMGATAVAVYSIGMSFHKYLMRFSTTISKVMTPKVFKDVLAGGEKKIVTNELIKISRIQSFGVYLALSGLIVFGKNFIDLWVGEAYREAYLIFIVTLIPYSFEIVGNLRNVILQANNLYMKKSILTLIISVLNVILTIILIQKRGIVGAALGTGIGVIVGQIGINAILIKYSCCEIGRYYKEVYLKLIPILIVMTLIGSFMKKIVVPETWMIFLIEVICYSIIYFVLLWIFVIQKNEKKLIYSTIIKKG